MAKDTKKSLKKLPKTTPTTETKTKEEVRKVAPPMPEGMISIVMSHEDMRVFGSPINRDMFVLG